MPTTLHLLLPLLASVGLGQVSCRSAEDPFVPTFEASVSLSASPGSPQPSEATASEELMARARHLDTTIVVGLGAGDDNLLTVRVNAPTEADARALLENLTSTGSLELRAVHPRSSKALWDAVQSGDELLPGYVPYEHHYTDHTGAPATDHLFLSKRGVIRGAQIRQAEPVPERPGVISVRLDHAGAEGMFRLTSAMDLGRDRIAVLFNDEVLSAPVVQGALRGEFVIEGIGERDLEPLCAALLSPYTTNLKLESLKPLAPKAAKP